MELFRGNAFQQFFALKGALDLWSLLPAAAGVEEAERGIIGFFALKAKRRRREGTYSLTHFGHLMFFISARGGGYPDWIFKL